MTNSDFKNLGIEPSKNFEVFNTTVYTINDNILTELTFGQSFTKIVSETQIQTTINSSVYNGYYQYVKYPTLKFTTNGIHSLILQSQLIDRTNRIFLLPRVLELGKLDSTNFGSVQSQVNIPCSIPVYYKTVMRADTCYTRDVEFLNSSILLVLQNYSNQHNVDRTNNLNNYGASLILYNIEQNKTVKIIALQNADITDYSYVYSTKNTNLVLLYYTNKITNEQGYLSINVDNSNLHQEYGNNLKTFTNALNHPLVINSKILVFYPNSYKWYSLNPQTFSIWANVLIYLGVLVVVLIMLPERWKAKLNIIKRIADFRKK